MLPYGWLADCFSRKHVYICSTRGLIFSIVWTLVVFPHSPVRAVLANSVFSLVWGGSSITAAMTSTIASDILPPEPRSTALFLLLSAYYLGFIGGKALTPLILSSPGPSFVLAIIALAVATTVAIITKDTLPPYAAHSRSRDQGTDDSSLSSNLLSIDKAMRSLRAKRGLAVIVVPPEATRGLFTEMIVLHVSKHYNWPMP